MATVLWRRILQLPGNFLLLMNMDFFQPFSHTTYSVGVIYCVVLNLPRELRYKTENIIVISVIPGPHEPKLNSCTKVLCYRAHLVF